MFGIGFSELCLIALAALVCIGPKNLPDFMRQAGKFFVQMRRMSNDVRSSFEQVIAEAEADLRKEEAQKKPTPLIASSTSEIREVFSEIRQEIDSVVAHGNVVIRSEKKPTFDTVLNLEKPTAGEPPRPEA